MSYNHNKKFVVVLLKSGGSIKPARFICINRWCKRTMMVINRDVELVLDNNKGVHWSDVPDNVTVVEHKCRGCDYYYKIYTPYSDAAKVDVGAMLDKIKVV